MHSLCFAYSAAVGIEDATGSHTGSQAAVVEDDSTSGDFSNIYSGKHPPQ